MHPFRPVTIRFGPPVDFWRDGVRLTTGRCPPLPGEDGGAATAPDPAAAERARQAEQADLRSLTDALMSEIARLSGQEYVDCYASRARPA